jgi:toxin CcdB
MQRITNSICKESPFGAHVSGKNDYFQPPVPGFKSTASKFFTDDDIADNPFPRSRARQPFLVVLQSDLLARTLDTVVVAPLERADSDTFADRLNPQVDIDGTRFVVVTQEVVTVRKNGLGAPRGTIGHERDKIIAALDLLFTGF